MQDKVGDVCAALEDHFWTYPDAEVGIGPQDGAYTPGPVVMMSEALVAGIAPKAFKKHVEIDAHAAGDSKQAPETVLGILVEAAKLWRVVENLEEMQNGSSKSSAPVNDV